MTTSFVSRTTIGTPPRAGRNLDGQYASAFYRLVQDSDGENNVVPVMTTTSISRKASLTEMGEV